MTFIPKTVPYNMESFISIIIGHHNPEYYCNITYNISMYDVVNSKRYASEKSVVVDIQNIKVNGRSRNSTGSRHSGKSVFSSGDHYQKPERS